MNEITKFKDAKKAKIKLKRTSLQKLKKNVRIKMSKSVNYLCSVV